jgi:CRISPR-associated protein Cas2
VDEHLYVVTYDIADPKRWRAVYELLKGYGAWLQLSVFQCRLSPKRHADMVATLDQIIHDRQDHVLILDLGVAEDVHPSVISLGKAAFEPVKREPVII